VLSEEEARRYGQEGEMVPVKALVAWTDVGKLVKASGFSFPLSRKIHTRRLPCS
jgi:hypothetical protein